MENSIYIALSRQTALRREMTLIANNIANVNTTGFRRELAVYSAQTVNPRSSTPMDFVIDHATAVSFEPGSLRQTGNTFDVAISGPGFGFFAVDDGSGTAYTRNGSFQLGDDNQLLTRTVIRCWMWMTGRLSFRRPSPMWRSTGTAPSRTARSFLAASRSRSSMNSSGCEKGREPLRH